MTNSPYRPPKSQEVLRQSRSDTPFRPCRPKSQSGAHSKKPRTVRGSERPRSPLSRFEGLVLAGRLRFEQSLLPNLPIHLPHQVLNLLIDALYAFLPAGIGAQLLFPSLSPYFTDGGHCLIAEPNAFESKTHQTTSFEQIRVRVAGARYQIRIEACRAGKVFVVGTS